MSKAWRHLDLAGGGLQAANIRLASMLKKRRVAYALLALFPLGLHRRYLEEKRGPWLYIAATALCLGLALTGHGEGALATGVLMAAAVAIDAFWIDRRVTRVNKQIRQQVFMGQGLTPPPGYSGRIVQETLDDYLHDKDAETITARSAPNQTPLPSTQRRVPPLAEQERMLAEIARAKARREPK